MLVKLTAISQNKRPFDKATETFHVEYLKWFGDFYVPNIDSNLNFDWVQKNTVSYFPIIWEKEKDEFVLDSESDKYFWKFELKER